MENLAHHPCNQFQVSPKQIPSLLHQYRTDCFQHLPIHHWIEEVNYLSCDLKENSCHAVKHATLDLQLLHSLYNALSFIHLNGGLK